MRQVSKLDRSWAYVFIVRFFCQGSRRQRKYRDSMRNHHFPKPDAIFNFFRYRYGNCMQTGFKLCVAASDLSSSVSEVVVQKLF